MFDVDHDRVQRIVDGLEKPPPCQDLSVAGTKRDSDYQRDTALINDTPEWDYTWSRTGNGGHTLTVYGAHGMVWHRHYRRDGSLYERKVCGCWS